MEKKIYYDLGLKTKKIVFLHGSFCCITVPKGFLEPETFSLHLRKFLLCLLEMFHLLKFLSWCGKNHYNYNKYFSYNFSFLERNIFRTVKWRFPHLHRNISPAKTPIGTVPDTGALQNYANNSARFLQGWPINIWGWNQDNLFLMDFQLSIGVAAYLDERSYEKFSYKKIQ